jgi:NTP pyrophosphatase (non-canonical NTP hydrolase)
MEFESIADRAMEIRRRYAKMEQAKYGRSWTTEELALGFVGDVGDLAKLIMAHSGVLAIPDATPRLAHELADCLWSVIVLARACNVDLEEAFLRTMAELEQHIDKAEQGAS